MRAEPFGGGWHVEAGHVLIVVDSPSPVFAAIGRIDEVDPIVEGILQRHTRRGNASPAVGIMVIF